MVAMGGEDWVGDRGGVEVRVEEAEVASASVLRVGERVAVFLRGTRWSAVSFRV